MDIENKYGALEYQQITLAMMKDIHRFLMSEGIKYSLCGGSLLGAIRESGFIPWDDDLDIMMDRENFEKFLTACGDFENYVVFRKLWIYRIQRKEDYTGSLTGATIDIFVVDRVPNSKIKQKYKLLALKLLQGMMKRHKDFRQYSLPKRIPVIVTYYFGRLFSDSKKFMWYDRISQVGNKESGRYVGLYDDLYSYIPKEYDGELMNHIALYVFEDSEFLITESYDNYLSVAYGEYMTPPPEDERKPQHS